MSTSDFVVGTVAIVDDSDCVSDRLATVGPDAVLRASQDALWVLERSTSDVLRRLDPLDPGSPVWEVALEQGANAHDLVEAEAGLVVAQYDLPWLSIRDPDTGAERGQVDLEDHADADGLVEADSLGWIGDRLFLALQRFDRGADWTSIEGRIIELDPQTAEVIQSWPTGPSPRLHQRPGTESLVVLTGVYGTPDGALSVFDGAELRVVFDEQTLGADLGVYAEMDGAGVVTATDFALGGEALVACLDWTSEDLSIGASEVAWYVDLKAGAEAFHLGIRSGWGGGDQAGVGAVDVDLCAVGPHRLATALEPYSMVWLQNEA